MYPDANEDTSLSTWEATDKQLRYRTRQIPREAQQKLTLEGSYSTQLTQQDSDIMAMEFGGSQSTDEQQKTTPAVEKQLRDLRVCHMKDVTPLREEEPETPFHLHITQRINGQSEKKNACSSKARRGSLVSPKFLGVQTRLRN